MYDATPLIQPHQKIWFSEFVFFEFLTCLPLWVFCKRNFNFSKIDDFLYPLPVQVNLLSGTNIFSLKNFFLFYMQKIKENFISFRNMFSKNKKRVNWSNNIVKTKCKISIEMGIFRTLLKSCFNMRYLTVIIKKIFLSFNLW